MARSLKLCALMIWFAPMLAFAWAETNKTGGSFSADLIHRDSPLSPFYDPSESDSDRLHKAVLRSISRMNYFKSILSPSSSASEKFLQAPLNPSEGDYLMTMSIGTPPVEFIAVADTGSDLTWVQCQPCTKCYKQKALFFFPERSSTYNTLTYESPKCKDLGSHRRRQPGTNLCGYYYAYGDGAISEGNLALENFSMKESNSGTAVTLSNIVFGCARNNYGGPFDENGSGLVGLGGGPVSLISQLSSSIVGKFSYCLVPLSSSATSKIKFGAPSFSGPGIFSTPLVDKEVKTFYYVTLEAISVGKEKLPYTSSDKGNIVIDSGTTATYINGQTFNRLVTILEKEIGHKSVPFGKLRACFRVTDKFDGPVITFHFSGNADLKLQPDNTFKTLRKDLVCLAIMPSGENAILGNIAQTNFLVQFDLPRKTVSFMPTDCTKQ